MATNRNPWKVSKRIESLYERLVRNLLKPVIKKAMEHSGSVEDFVKILENASNSKTFRKKSKEIAKQMITLTLKEESKSWRHAAKKSAMSPYLLEYLKKEMSKGSFVEKRYNELLERNTKIIITLPVEISKDVVAHVSTKAFEGVRADEIAKEIKQFFPQHTKAKEKLIARTEAAKCKSALTQARSEELGIDWAIWVTVGDSVVRSTHNIMDNVICNYKHPPSPEDLARKAGIYDGKSYGKYLAGEIFNCRCFMDPLISFSQVKFPAKVYNWKTERIEIMTKEQFVEFGGKEAD